APWSVSPCGAPDVPPGQAVPAARSPPETRRAAYWETRSETESGSARRAPEPPAPPPAPDAPQMPPVKFSSESTRSYRRISGAGGKAAAAPQSPEDPAPGKAPPVPMPRRFAPAKGRQKRVKAVADCKGDKARELTFSKGEVIVVTREEDEQSWVSVRPPIPTLSPPASPSCPSLHPQVGFIEGDGSRTGVFPASFVHLLQD
ncbi:ASAP2 protein, partial [Eudromia elegans]|nr:ASAP2 protein [Eudromia elegans]